MSTSESTPQSDVTASTLAITRLHLCAGWWAFLVFLTLGVALEALHAIKAPMYLDVGNETRRLMWTLSHAHGTLLSVVHIAFAATVSLMPAWNANSRSLASRCLLAGSLLVPAGFFLGGVFIYRGDPGLGALLVPAGAVLLFVAAFLTARGVKSLNADVGGDGES